MMVIKCLAAELRVVRHCPWPNAIDSPVYLEAAKNSLEQEDSAVERKEPWRNIELSWED